MSDASELRNAWLAAEANGHHLESDHPDIGRRWSCVVCGLGVGTNGVRVTGTAWSTRCTIMPKEGT